MQTRGNLSFFIHKQVKCVVVGSLVTTHRKFKGLLLLNRSPLAKPILNPSYNDFCPRDLPVSSGSAVSLAAGSARVNRTSIWASWVLHVWFFMLAFEEKIAKVQPHRDTALFRVGCWGGETSLNLLSCLCSVVIVNVKLLSVFFPLTGEVFRKWNIEWKRYCKIKAWEVNKTFVTTPSEDWVCI